MDLANLRKLQPRFEDFPKNHNLILIGQPCLLSALDLGVNREIKSRITYSVVTKRFNPDDLRDFLLRQLDCCVLGHNTFTQAALDLVVRSADGVLRKARNLGVGCLIEAVRSSSQTIDIVSTPLLGRVIEVSFPRPLVWLQVRSQFGSGQLLGSITLKKSV